MVELKLREIKVLALEEIKWNFGSEWRGPCKACELWKITATVVLCEMSYTSMVLFPSVSVVLLASWLRARARTCVCVCIMNIAVIRNDCVVSMKGIFVIFRQVLSPCVVAVLPLCCVLVTLFALLEWISLTIYVRLVSYACWIEMILFEWCIYYALFVLW